MEPVVVPSGEVQPLTVVDDPAAFKNVYDVPFVTVNRIGHGEYLAEVIMSGVAEIDQDRIDTAHSVGREHGARSFARMFSDLGADEGYYALHIHMSDDPAKGLIWSLENELGAAWSQ